jgi:predicted PilT family ATPase
MSLHIQQGQTITAKKGQPGKRELVDLKQLMPKQELAQLIETLMAEVQQHDDAFVEIDRPASKVLQI